MRRYFMRTFFLSLVPAAIVALGFAQQAAQAAPEIHRFICSGGSADFIQEPNGKLGFGRTNRFLKCMTPKSAGSTVGLDVVGIESRYGFRLINMVFVDNDGSSVSSVTVRFCFKVGKTIVSEEIPLSHFHIIGIPNTPYSECFLSNGEFENPAIERGSAILIRVTASLASSNHQTHSLTFGRTVIDTQVSDIDPRTIVMEDQGCSPLEGCTTD